MNRDCQIIDLLIQEQYITHLNLFSYIMTVQKKISVRKGEIFEIQLESNPTTGYRWYTSFDNRIVNFTNENYKINSQESNKNNSSFGKPGYQIFKFKAIKAGKTIIKIKYQRSWEKEPIESRVYFISIN